jgi:predicted SAM-dependent methyltransferase
MGEANIARQIEYSRLLDILPIIFDSQEEQVAGLVYLPSDGRNRHKGQKTLEKIIKLNNSYLQAFYLLPLDLISQLVEEEEQSSNGQTNYHGEQVPVSNSTTKIQLHIGGKEVHPDWKILDIESRPEVDYVGDASRLDLFEDNSVDAIYASHVLEHFYYGINNELTNTLKEWHRVLQPGGKLFISVPNLKTICYLYLNPKFTLKERFHLMRIIFGGQTNIYDVHKVGFDIDILGMYLQSAGFKKWGQVSEFNIFNDCSGLRILDTLISLNVIATK